MRSPFHRESRGEATLRKLLQPARAGFGDDGIEVAGRRLVPEPEMLLKLWLVLPPIREVFRRVDRVRDPRRGRLNVIRHPFKDPSQRRVHLVFALVGQCRERRDDDRHGFEVHGLTEHDVAMPLQKLMARCHGVFNTYKGTAATDAYSPSRRSFPLVQGPLCKPPLKPLRVPRRVPGGPIGANDRVLPVRLTRDCDGPLREVRPDTDQIRFKITSSSSGTLGTVSM